MTNETAPTLAETDALLADFSAWLSGEPAPSDRAWLSAWYADSPSGIAIENHLAGHTVYIKATA